MKKRLLKTIGSIIGVIILIIVIYHFLFGRLFPWSPVQFGFKQLDFSKVVVILPKDATLPPELENIDDIVAETEQFHQLQFKKPVNVILPETHHQHTRFSGVKALACALQTGTVVYLSPDIPKKGRRRVDLLKHELSHALLFQNTTFLKAFKIPEWLQEGLAIYYGNPNDNFVGDAFIKAAVDDGYFFDVLQAKAEIQKIPLEHRYSFLHSEYRCFLEYLVEQFGLARVIDYMKAVIGHPEMEYALFYQIFNVELEEMADKFKQDVLAKRKNLT